VDSSLPLALQQRYDALAGQPATSLSCGGAADLAQPGPGQVCVDLGCGRGRDLVTLARAVGPTGRVIGLDASPRMVEAARARAAEEGLTHVTARQCPLEALDLPDASVDLVVSNCALNHAADKRRVWSEIARVLRPGGRFVVSDIYAVEPIDPAWRQDPVAVAECWAGAETRADYLGQIAAAGLVGLEILSEKAPYRKQHALLSSFTLRGHRPG
jgi:ubiquinone/menaquinone biosynthesis C-methylase UbiE